MAPSLRIGAPLVSSNGGRVSAQVGATEVWFESDELPLAGASEAFASAFLIPAAACGRQLELEAAVCPVWRSGAAELLPIVGGWWGYRSAIPSGGALSAIGRRDAQSVALCFSGGVDSFHTLLRRPGNLDLLVAGHGYDIPLADVGRMARFESSIREVAGAMGMRWCVVRSNIREHPDFSGVSWERTHGGALAALGHLLRDAVGRIVISSSAARRDAYPWGSHWETDPLFGSSRLVVEHFGEGARRAEKLAEIASEPLVRRHLRVCWRNDSEEVNCGRCEKCVRTQVVLAACGELPRYRLFAGSGALADRIDGVAAASLPLLLSYQWALDRGLDPRVGRSVRALIRRSRRAALTHALARTATRAARALIRVPAAPGRLILART